LFAAFIPKGMFPIFYVETLTVVLAAIAAILVGVFASIFPIQRAVRTSIVQGLRFIG
jgi:ABC-type antimicrobial peptide transport system permease subunit